MSFTHQQWMSKALEYAQLKFDAATEVPISALVVKNDVLISKATNLVELAQDATAHAEIVAIREAGRILGWRLEGCVLYTTLEPCVMCAGAIINSRISKLVFGAYDLNAGVCGSKINVFNDLNKNNSVEIIGGILEEECSKLLKDFFIRKRESKS